MQVEKQVEIKEPIKVVNQVNQEKNLAMLLEIKENHQAIVNQVEKLDLQSSIALVEKVFRVDLLFRYG